MIARLRGRIDEKGRDYIVVDVAGVGYIAYVSGSTLAATGTVGSEVQLRVYTHVREETLQLFGFLTAAEQETFERLLAVSGIGPKMALSFLTQFTPEELGDAVARRDSAALARVRGVGKRTAERLVLELQGKLQPATPGIVAARPVGIEDDVASALMAMGYAAAEAAAALALVPAPGAASPEERVMLALRQLDRLRA